MNECRIETLKQNKSAFTIVELLVVIVIIGVLATISFVSYQGIQKKATSASMQSDLSNVKYQIELFRADNNDILPTAIAANCTSSNDTLCIKTSGNNTLSSTIDPTHNTYCVSINNNNQNYYFTESATVAEGTCTKFNDGSNGANNTVKGSYEGKLTNIDSLSLSYPSKTGSYGGNNNTIIARGGYNSSVTSLQTHISVNQTTGFKVGASGVNDLSMSPVVDNTRQVLVVVTGSYLTSNLSITSFQIKFGDGSTKTLAQAVADGYIEPLVLITSNLPWASSCYWSDILNIYTDTATSSVSFPTANVIFTLKNYQLTNVMIGLNKATHSSDGILIQSIDRGVGVSLL